MPCYVAASAPRTRSGVNGTSRSRTPTASNTAFAIAAGVGGCARLAASEVRLPGPVDEDRFHRRDLREAKNRIALPVGAGHAQAVESDLLLERPARGLDQPTLELVGETARVDHLPGIGRDDGTHGRDLPAVAVDQHLDDDRGIGLLVLVAREGETMAAAGFPPAADEAGVFGGGGEDRPSALVVEVAQPERQRVDVGGVRQRVHAGLDREHIGVGAEAAQRRRTEWRRTHEMLDDAAGRDRVERIGIAVNPGVVKVIGCGSHAGIGRSRCQAARKAERSPNGSGRYMCVWLHVS